MFGMPGYDPTCGEPYGLWLRNKGVQTNAGRTSTRVREGRDDDGRIIRKVTEHTDSGAIAITTNRTSQRGEHQDVHIHAPRIESVSEVMS